MKIIPQTKIGKVFFAAVVLIILLFLFILTMEIYGRASGIEGVNKLAKELQRMEQENYAKKAADKAGGKTPQETLELFIAAVEAGDYELASKYFVIEKQEKEQEELQAIRKANNLEQFLNILKKAESDGEIENSRFRMRSKLEVGPPDYFIEFIQYSSGNWKIEKI